MCEPHLPSTATAQGYLAAGFGADLNESVSSISRGGRGCAKHWTPPLIAMYATLVFVFSNRMSSRLRGFTGQQGCGVIPQELGSCHDLLGSAIALESQRRSHRHQRATAGRRWPLICMYCSYRIAPPGVPMPNLMPCGLSSLQLASDRVPENETVP